MENKPSYSDVDPINEWCLYNESLMKKELAVMSRWDLIECATLIMVRTDADHNFDYDTVYALFECMPIEIVYDYVESNLS